MFSRRFSAIDNVLGVFILAGLIGTTWFFLHHWQWAYNSDTVVAGIAGKRFLSHGEWPIFVGFVGYQGLLLETPLMAAVFALFGVGPVQLDLVPTFFYWILLVVFYVVCQRGFDRTASLLATLVLVLSPADWFAVVMRSIPNYPQTYLSGLLLFLVYVRIVRDLLQSKVSVSVWMAWGALAGFSFYNYGQIIYFFVAVGMHATLFYARSEVASQGALLRALFPVHNGSLALRAFQWFTIFFAGVMTIMMFVPVSGLRIGRNVMDPAKFFFVAAVAFCISHAVNFVWRHRAELWRQRLPIVALGLAFWGGYFPKIYYNSVLKLNSINNFRVGGFWKDIFHRLDLLHLTVQQSYGAPPDSWQIWIVPNIIFLAVGFFLFIQARIAWRFIQSEIEIERFTQVSFFFPLFFAILLPLICSEQFVDISAQRYSFGLFLVLAAAFGFSVVYLFRSLGTSVPRRALAVVCACALALVLVQSVREYRRAAAPNERVQTLQALGESLKDRGITTAFSSYWFAFSVHFLHPELSIEPLYGKYFSHFSPIVHASDRVALIEPRFDEATFDVDNKGVTVERKHFRITELYEVNGIRVWILERDS